MWNLDYQVTQHQWVKYGSSKVENTLYSTECARRYDQVGLVSVVSHNESQFFGKQIYNEPLVLPVSRSRSSKDWLFTKYWLASASSEAD